MRAHPRRVFCGLAALLFAVAVLPDEIAADQIKPQQYPTGWNCSSVPATDRARCEKTQIAPPKLEDPPAPPATGNPQPLYPGGKLPPPAAPPAPKLPLPPPGSGT